MSEAAESTRNIIKTVSFSAEQWTSVERRFLLSGEKNFSRFVRTAILDKEIRVQQITFDPRPLGAELARIGNNINQIARLVNTESVTTLEEMKATRALVREIQGLIERASKGE